MRRNPRLIVFLILLATSSFAAQSAQAQLSFSAPTSGNDVVVPTSSDYATDVLGNPWDMDSEHDLADYFNQETGSPIANRTFSGGVFSFNITSGASAFFHMLSPGICSSNQGKTGVRYPIDSTKYRYLSMRMYSEVVDEIYFLWYTSCGGPEAKYRRTAATLIQPGWHTYTIDLQTIGYSENGNGETRSWTAAGQVTGLRVDPGGNGASANSPLVRKIDWITLSASPPATSAEINFNVSPQGSATRYSLALDDDGDLSNGVTKWLVQDGNASAGAVTMPINSYGMFYGANSVVGYLSSDWRTLMYDDPWDFNSMSDVASLTGMSGSISSGSLTGRTSSSLNVIYLDLKHSSFSGNTYNQLCFEATLSTGGVGCILSTGGNTCFSALAGQHTYSLDLASLWAGDTISTVALSLADHSGVDYSLHWVSLERSACSSSDTLPTNVAATGNVVMNHPPVLKILQPDAKGGADFASSILNNPWNFNDSNDIKSLTNIASAAIYPNNNKFGRQGDFFCVTSIAGNDDPYHPFLDEGLGSPNSIPSRFKNVSITMYVDSVQNDDSGHTMRIIPCNFERDGLGACMSGDDTFYPGQAWTTVTQDMNNGWQLEQVLHPNPPNPLWAGNFNQFRIDVIEALTPTTYCIDRVEVREDDRSDSKFQITYTLEDDDSDPGAVSVSFYYSTVRGAISGGTPISGAQGLSVSRDTNNVEFDTSGLADGTYYIYGIADDGMNTTAVAAAGALKVDHAAGQDVTAPNISVNHPDDGRTVYTSSGMVVDGYALDNIQLASVEVLIDGDLVHRIIPSNFDKTARDAYPSYADSSNAGFFETVSLAGITPGARTVRFHACDTNANCTDIDRSVIVAGGTDPAPITAPAAQNESPLNLLLVTPSLSAKISKKNILSVAVNNTQQCESNIRIMGALTKGEVTGGTASQLFSVTPGGRATLSLKSKSKLSRINATGKQAVIYLGVACGNGNPPAAKKLGLAKISTSKSVKRTKYPSYLAKTLREG